MQEDAAVVDCRGGWHPVAVVALWAEACDSRVPASMISEVELLSRSLDLVFLAHSAKHLLVLAVCRFVEALEIVSVGESQVVRRAPWHTLHKDSMAVVSALLLKGSQFLLLSPCSCSIAALPTFDLSILALVVHFLLLPVGMFRSRLATEANEHSNDDHRTTGQRLELWSTHRGDYSHTPLHRPPQRLGD